MEKKRKKNLIYYTVQGIYNLLLKTCIIHSKNNSKRKEKRIMIP